MDYGLCGCGLKRILYSLIANTDSSFRPVYDAQIAEYLIDANRQKYPLGKMQVSYVS